jgi:bifunctional DNA-binding transcriptional regulator/antitoxin component of YhaV-PrlF toxin-antitoxin module
VLPLELRRRLGLSAGDEVRISEEADGALRVESRRAAARALIGLAGLPGTGVLDDLREERSRQAAAEERDVGGIQPSARKATVEGRAR